MQITGIDNEDYNVDAIDIRSLMITNQWEDANRSIEE